MIDYCRVTTQGYIYVYMHIVYKYPFVGGIAVMPGLARGSISRSLRQGYDRAPCLLLSVSKQASIQASNQAGWLTTEC